MVYWLLYIRALADGAYLLHVPSIKWVARPVESEPRMLLVQERVGAVQLCMQSDEWKGWGRELGVSGRLWQTGMLADETRRHEMSVGDTGVLFYQNGCTYVCVHPAVGIEEAEVAVVLEPYAVGGLKLRQVPVHVVPQAGVLHCKKWENPDISNM